MVPDSVATIVKPTSLHGIPLQTHGIPSLIWVGLVPSAIFFSCLSKGKARVWRSHPHATHKPALNIQTRSQQPHGTRARARCMYHARGTPGSENVMYTIYFE